MKDEKTLTEASRQWFSRPEDQRFLTIEDLKKSVENRKRESWTVTAPAKDLRAVAGSEGLEKTGGLGPGAIGVEVFDPTKGERRIITPTNYAFGQLSQYANAPAAYLRRLPAGLAAINLQWGLERASIRDDALILAQSNGENTLRAMTSTSYGRIWDLEVVEAVERVNRDGRWKVPAASYATQNPKRATTLYSSDRDVFVFLVDETNPVDVGGEQMFRGFYTWNSEVGSAVFGLTTFLYRYCCDNRIIWGARDIKELRIRHTGGAPERFAYEGAKYLSRYAEGSTAEIVNTIKRADTIEKPEGWKDGTDRAESWEGWLRSRGFTGTQAKNSVASAVAEEGETRSLWNIVNGITAYARQIPHTDERVKLEAAAGRLLEYAVN